MGEVRTEYPVIELWIARQRLYTLEENIRLFDLNAKDLFSHVVGAKRDLAQAEKFLRRTRRMLEAQSKEASEVVSRFQGAKDLDVEDWIKVISIKEVESASFYDPDAYAMWFSRVPEDLAGTRASS